MPRSAPAARPWRAGSRLPRPLDSFHERREHAADRDCRAVREPAAGACRTNEPGRVGRRRNHLSRRGERGGEPPSSNRNEDREHSAGDAVKRKAFNTMTGPTMAPTAAMSFTSPAPVAPSAWPGSIRANPTTIPRAAAASETPLAPVAAIPMPVAAIAAVSRFGMRRDPNVDDRCRDHAGQAASRRRH